MNPLASPRPVVAHFVREVARQDRSIPMPQRLGLAAHHVIGCAGLAATLAYTDPSRLTVCITSELARRIENLQEVLGQGPGSQAYTSGRAVFATLDPAQVQASDERWPLLSQAAAEHALPPVGVLALPMRSCGHVIGVLTCTTHDRRGPALQSGDCRLLADAMATLLVNDCDRTWGERVDGPWGSYTRVHVATGMITARLGVGGDDAVALLRGHAFAHVQSLDEVADDVVSGRLAFTLDGEPPSSGELSA